MRAYRVDKALLETHIKMLKKEIERVEHLSLGQEHVGSFLTENKVWDTLGKGAHDVDSDGKSARTV
jgi:hypothetical protein